METLKMDLIKILDEGIQNKKAIERAEKLEELNNQNKLALNADLIEIFELLTLVKAGELEELESLEERAMKAIYKAIEQKKEAFEKYIYRKNYLVDEDRIDKADVVLFDSGIYLQFYSCRNELSVFVNNAGKVIRKPRKAIELERIFLNNLNISVY